MENKKIKKFKKSEDVLICNFKKIVDLLDEKMEEIVEDLDNLNANSQEISSPDNKKIKIIKVGERAFDVQTNLYNFNPTGKLYYCPTCLQSWPFEISYHRHLKKCSGFIYGSQKICEQDNLKVYKVHGWDNVAFCQSLCILGRCFIDNKTLFLDIENYNFYLLFDNSEFVGYFSEEKYSEKYNLSCILILPDHQKKGFGSLLVDLSYKLKSGTPEKPLSTPGANLYKNFWRYKIFHYLKNHKNEEKSILEISKETNLTVNDVIIGLELNEIDLNTNNIFTIN